MTKYLTAKSILEANDSIVEEVSVPEWGGVVLVRSLSGLERDLFEMDMAERRKKGESLGNIRASMVATATVGADKKPLFSQKDVKALGEKSAIALDRVFDVAMKLAGIRDGEEEEISANFPNGQSVNSISN